MLARAARDDPAEDRGQNQIGVVDGRRAELGVMERRLAPVQSVAEQIGGGAGATLNRVAETAFSSAMSSTLTVAAAVAMAGALVALVVLPGRERERVEKRTVHAEAAAAAAWP